MCPLAPPLRIQINERNVLVVIESPLEGCAALPPLATNHSRVGRCPGQQASPLRFVSVHGAEDNGRSLRCRCCC